MNGFYTDESGNNGFGDVHQPVLCYGGILVPHIKQVELDQKFQGISDDILRLIKEKITGVPNDELRNIPFFGEFEFHARAFIHGEGFYSKLPQAKRFDFVKQILSLVDNLDIHMYATVINKLTYKDNEHETNAFKMYELGYSELVKLLNVDLEQCSQTCFIVADNGKEQEQQLFRRILRQQSGDFFVYPDLQIKDSHNSNLIQIADLIVFVTSVFFRHTYGFPPGKLNTEIVDVFNQHMTKLQFWKYK